MIQVVSIVEGDGEVAALPILLRRLATECVPASLVSVLPPLRVRRDRFLNKPDEFKRQLLLAAAKSGEQGWILIVLDADDDCPKDMGADIHRRAQEIVPHRRLSVVLANREFEAWFIAAAHSLQGMRGFHIATDAHVDAERPRDAKGWMRERMRSGTYRELVDQPAFAAQFDLQQAHDNSRSFRKLCKEWRMHVSQRAS